MIRTEDVFARFGGEEFVLLLTEQTGEAAVLVAMRIRSLIESHAFEHENATIRVTVSIGVATYAGGNYSSPAAMIAAADTALYDAKNAGRNRVVSRQRDRQILAEPLERSRLQSRRDSIPARTRGPI